MNLILSKIVHTALILAFIIFSVGFTVIEDGGYVAVRNEQTQELCRTEVRIDMLPQSDVERIAQGIACENASELARVMENFCA